MIAAHLRVVGCDQALIEHGLADIAAAPADVERVLADVSGPRFGAWTSALAGKVALVAGATRGAGRGIAVQLGAAGATVYCTGRTTRAQRSEMDRPETIEETAELVDEAGGARHRGAGRPPRARRGGGAGRAHPTPSRARCTSS